MTWTKLTNAQKTHLIQSVWRENISSSEIGKAVGCSRNAIVGHYRRHPVGLERYPLQVSAAHKHATGQIAESTIIRRQYADNHKKPKRVTVRKTIAPSLPVHEIPSTGGVGLYVTLVDNTGCTWPLNDGGPYLFCGHAKFGKYAYCEHHHERSRGRGTVSERSAHRVSDVHASS